ncbi:MAG: PIN domain-containing protein [Bifidobacteriaceae bacterium]|nr:PIN domain-containing protein [Bifidobacteriaceae bacterium]
MATLDTNCLLRWLTGDVPEQAADVEALIARGREWAVPDVALLEVVFVLEKVNRLPRQFVAEAIQTVLAQDAFAVDRELWGELSDVYLALPKLSAADIYLVLDARRRGREPVYTFDRKLAAQLPGAAPVPASQVRPPDR